VLQFTRGGSIRTAPWHGWHTCATVGRGVPPPHSDSPRDLMNGHQCCWMDALLRISEVPVAFLRSQDVRCDGVVSCLAEAWPVTALEAGCAMDT
jgi:hypothetical protein